MNKSITGDECMNKFEVNLNELLMTFSLMLDLAENKPLQHTKKVAFIASIIIRELNKDHLLEQTLQAALLHDIGVIPSVFKFGREAFVEEEGEFFKQKKNHHATTGWEIAKELPIEKEISDIIKYHHERCDGSGPYGLLGNDIPLLSQVIGLADQFELKFEPKRDSLGHRNEIIDWLKQEKDKSYKGEIVDALLRRLGKDKLWFDLGTFNIEAILQEIIPQKIIKVDIDQLEKIAKAFSIVIDQKSAFTHQHSIGVSDKAYLLAKSMGYDGIKSKKIRVAAYLHDFGKLVVPNEIIDKPDKLLPEEMLVIKKHPYYSKYILKQIKGFEDIAEWGSNHHENLLGTGYPEGISGDEFSEESQIIAICDIYQALIEDRIYRKGMEQKRALEIISSLVEKGYYSQYIFNEFLKCLSFSSQNSKTGCFNNQHFQLNQKPVFYC